MMRLKFYLQTLLKQRNYFQASFEWLYHSVTSQFLLKDKQSHFRHKRFATLFRQQELYDSNL